MSRKKVHIETGYSEEMQELMGQVPPWFARSGFYALLGVLVMVFVSGYLIPYNEYYETACEYHQNKEAREAGYILSVVPAWDALRIQMGQKAELTFRGVPGTKDLILKGSISSMNSNNPDDKVNIQYQIDGSFSADSLAGHSKSGIVKILIREARLIDHLIYSQRNGVLSNSKEQNPNL